MSSADKILESIIADSEQRIAAVNAEADKIYQDAITAAEKKAVEIRHNAEGKIQQQSERMLAAYKSRAELERRNMLLKTRRDEIEKTISGVLEYIKKLDDRAYFDLLLKMAKQLTETSGVLLLSERDLKRLPPDFSQRLANAGIQAEIASQPCQTIDSGFILKNGDIEENMSFEAVIADRREQIEDMISKALFQD